MKQQTQLKPWQTPTIKPHTVGAMNKFGHITNVQQNYIADLEGIAITDLIEKYGSPLFVTSEEKLRNNIRKLKRAFENRYPNVIHGWSYKTNYNGAVCNILHQEGSWAEVVSAFEYQKAKQLGIPGNRIIFNGPNKSKNILAVAIEDGAKIHVDNFDELRQIESLAEELDKQVSLTLRLNFDTGYTEAWSRFGFNIEAGQAMEAARFIFNSPRLRLTGLHSHIGTFVLDPRAYTAQITIMCQFMAEVESLSDSIIESLDIGGGFASKNALQGLYLPPDQIVPSFDQYAEAICTPLLLATREREKRGLQRPTLILESGRAVIDDAQVLLSSVVSTRRLPDGRASAVMDAGVNLLFTAFWYNHQVQLTAPLHGLPEDTVLYGPLCMNIDIIRKSVLLPPLNLGDTVLIESVGAYNNTQWMQFIEYRPNVVLIHAGGKQEVSVIRAAEDLGAMTAQEQLPSHLGNPFGNAMEQKRRIPKEAKGSVVKIA